MNDIIFTLTGGFLSALGGFFAIIFKKKEQINYIKISLIDEIEEIERIIGHICESCRMGQAVPVTCFNELSENTESFDSNKQKLYLIHDKVLRKDITKFYKDLKSYIEKSITIVGRLNPDASGASDNQIKSDSEKVKHNAANLKIQITKYKFKPLFFI